MFIRKGGLAAAIFVVAGFYAASASAEDGARRYSVTITNLTSGLSTDGMAQGQILSPHVTATHDAGFTLFENGQAASAGLYTLAEDGMPGALAAEIQPDVDSVVQGGGPTLPGESTTFEITASGNAKYLSVATMLVTTNDAFAAVRSLRLPGGVGKSVRATGNAYDAGSEANTEDCAHIPGPPCGNADVRVTEGAEGYIHIHAGIHGIEDLIPAYRDWRNPVIEVTVTRLEDED